MHPADVDIAAMYREWGPAIWAHARRAVRSREDADELVQETFVAAARNLTALAAAASPRAWLFGIARNLIREYFRRARIRSTVRLEVEVPAPPAGNREEIAAMREAVAGLPDAHREVIEFRFREGLSYAEIADVLGIPIGTVRSRLHHAIAILKEWAARELALDAAPRVGVPAHRVKK